MSPRVLVNNAGAGVGAASLLETSPALSSRRILRLNVVAPYLLLRALAPRLAASGARARRQHRQRGRHLPHPALHHERGVLGGQGSAGGLTRQAGRLLAAEGVTRQRRAPRRRARPRRAPSGSKSLTDEERAGVLARVPRGALTSVEEIAHAVVALCARRSRRDRRRVARRQQRSVDPVSTPRLLVTGGGSGFGAATARLAAARGTRVAILDLADRDGVASHEPRDLRGGRRHRRRRRSTPRLPSRASVSAASTRCSRTPASTACRRRSTISRPRSGERRSRSASTASSTRCARWCRGLRAPPARSWSSARSPARAASPPRAPPPTRPRRPAPPRSRSSPRSRNWARVASVSTSSPPAAC